MLNVSLFGQLEIKTSDGVLIELEGHKARELLCFLLLHRDRPVLREVLASELWGEQTSLQSLKQLRQALWRLQTSLPFDACMFKVESAWVQLCNHPELNLDVAQFEQTVALAQGCSGNNLNDLQLDALRQALSTYQADLLEGWQHDWCLTHRERLQNLRLIALEKLAEHCETSRNFELGLVYTNLMLEFDAACETAHQRAIRLYALAGNRTAALRQYERCAVALRSELDVKPARSTTALFERIRDDEPLLGTAVEPLDGVVVDSVAGMLSELRHLMFELRSTLQRNPAEGV
jgi:DNA-binding SARP family transcriptional activator